MPCRFLVVVLLWCENTITLYPGQTSRAFQAIDSEFSRTSMMNKYIISIYTFQIKTGLIFCYTFIASKLGEFMECYILGPLHNLTVVHSGTVVPLYE